MSKKLNTNTDLWYDAAGLIKKNPRILFPLTVVAFLEALWLELLYFTPYPPLNPLFLPPVKRFFGELALHYPTFLFVLPKLFGLGQILIYIVAGGLLTGATVLLAASAAEHRLLSFQAAWKKAKGRLWALVLAALFMAILLRLLTSWEGGFFRAGFDFAGRGLLRSTLRFLLKLLPYANFFIAIGLQVFILFAIPLIVLENQPLFRAIGKSVALGGRHFLKIYGLLLLPMLCYSPLWFLKGSPALLVRATLFPEVIPLVVGLGIVATLLVDTFIAVIATLFLLRSKQ